MNKVLLGLICIVLVSPVFSHEFSPAHLIIEEDEDFEYEVTWMYPIRNLGPVNLTLPKDCQSNSLETFQESKYLSEKISLQCSDSIKGKDIFIKGLSILNDALVTIKFLDGDRYEGLVSVKDSKLTIPQELQVFPTGYFMLGVEHLIGGPDHLLFVFGLLFIVFGWQNLIKTITAFTLAHSITLGLSVLEIVSLPSATIEALIALTIIYLALEIKDEKNNKSTPWLMAFGFGLLHGFGFAGALSEIGIANEQLLLSLLFFNVGIEIGQLIMIPLFLISIWLLQKIKFNFSVTKLSSYAIGGMGSFWLIERVLGIF
ncbi:HupE/UreJ family protein [SAR86 cluster bacterium]|jgi:hydrogenase/urease accessory protein HupE|nr:HupE/UreJ family protein [SAR86 cluster bacterium]